MDSLRCRFGCGSSLSDLTPWGSRFGESMRRFDCRRTDFGTCKSGSTRSAYALPPPKDCAHFCAHSTHRSVARDCQSRRAEGPQAFEDSRHIATLRKTTVPPLSPLIVRRLMVRDQEVGGSQDPGDVWGRRPGAGQHAAGHRLARRDPARW